jgi:L-fuconolactonase
MQSLNDLDETAEFLELAARMERILGVVGWVPLTGPDATARSLDALHLSDNLVGVRHLINFEPDPGWLLSPNVQESVDVIASRGLVFDSVPNDPLRFEAVLATAERRPGMRVVIDHLGRPPVAAAGWEPWASLISRAAELPNVSIKLSVGLDIALGWTLSTEELRRYADHTLDCFGPERVMAASNWPVSTLAGDYGAIWRGIRILVSDLAPPEREMVLGGTARQVFGLTDADRSVLAEAGESR